MNLKDLYAKISVTKKKKKSKNLALDFLAKHEAEIVAVARELITKGQFDFKKFLKTLNAFALEKGMRKEIRKPNGQVYFTGIQIKRADLESFLKSRGILK